MIVEEDINGYKKEQTIKKRKELQHLLKYGHPVHVVFVAD
jgi:hypothetical protein